MGPVIINSTANLGVGGDIFILHRAQPLGAVILTEESTYISSELEFGEAYEEGGLRCWATEQKLKCESDLASQLKANMVLLSSLLLDENIEKKSHWDGGDIFNNVLWFACRTYSSSNLAKSRMDFQSGTMTFEELYKIFPCIQLPLLVDRVIIYILQNLSQP